MSQLKHARPGDGRPLPLVERPVPLDSLPPFKYESLPPDHFRLLHIIAHDSYLSCSLEEYSLSTPPAYSAVSYAWGNPTNSRTISCNNQRLAVSDHVHNMLIDLWTYTSKLSESNHEGYYLWIDSLCINQSDLAEKASQVHGMGGIYSKAEDTTVWLGPSADNSDQLIQNMGAFISSIEAQTLYRQTARTDTALSAPDSLETDPFLRAALAAFFCRPWFTRLWVVQEVLLAKQLKFLCGFRYVCWKELDRLCDSLHDLSLTFRTQHLFLESQFPGFQYLVYPGVSSLASLLTYRGMGPIVGGLPYDLLALLFLAVERRDVTLPVDRVWALLGLTSVEVQRSLRDSVDYSHQGLFHHHLAYMDFARAILLNDPNLNLLSQSPSLKHSNGLLSWCPDFENIYPRAFMDSDGFHAGNEYDDHQQSPKIEFSGQPPVLKAWGCRMDQVESVVAALSEDKWEDEKEWHNRRRTWEENCLKVAQRTYGLPNDVPDGHWRSLVFDQGPDGSRCQSEDKQAYLLFRDSLQELSSCNPQRGVPSDNERAQVRWFKDNSRRSFRCFYFSTRGGRVGLAPFQPEAGDSICIFHGSKVPRLVRFPRIESDPSNKKQAPGRLISDAYVHGLMYGEMFSMERHEEFIGLE